jgi:hypothetical protein
MFREDRRGPLPTTGLARLAASAFVSSPAQSEHTGSSEVVAGEAGRDMIPAAVLAVNDLGSQTEEIRCGAG